MSPEPIGWAATAILLLTLGRQVWVQYRERTGAGVSSWLFVGQLAASTGFVAYSWLLDNWVFLFSNVAILLVAIAGQLVYRHNRRREASRPG